MTHGDNGLIELDYKAVFARELLLMINEVFPAHGIDQMDEEEVDQLVIDVTRECYWPIMGEFRKKSGLSLTRGFHFHW